MEHLQAYYTSNNGNAEWYTPNYILEKVRSLSPSGVIDLDPFSCETAQRTVNARYYFTKEQDAMKQEWPKVDLAFVNPPYSRNLIGEMIDRVVVEYRNGTFRQAVVLVNNATETLWFHKLLETNPAICIFLGRIRFYEPVNTKRGGNTRGQIVMYLGEDKDRFVKAFSEFGVCFLNSEF